MQKKRVLIVNNEPHPEMPGGIPEISKALLEVAPVEIDVIHFRELLRENYPVNFNGYVILAGRQSTDWHTTEWEFFAGEWQLIKTTELPLLGICAGHQMLALAYDCKLDILPGGTIEQGISEINIIKRDKLFRGLPETIAVYQYHGYQVAEIPREFEVLAVNELCAVQAMRHRTKPVYGVQFHPEKFTADCSHGKIILKNFLRLP